MQAYCFRFYFLFVTVFISGRMVGVAKLSYAPRLRLLLIQKDQIARVSFRDISDCFYVFGVDEEHAPPGDGALGAALLI